MKDYYLEYGKRQHRELLQDSLDTSCIISFNEFKHLLGDYRYYGFDERCNQILFYNNENVYDWLYIEIKGLSCKTM